MVHSWRKQHVRDQRSEERRGTGRKARYDRALKPCCCSESNFCRGSRVGCMINLSQAARLPLQFGLSDPRDLSVRSDLKREWKIVAKFIQFLALSSSQSVSASPSQLAWQPRTRYSPARLQWAIGQRMRPECVARSLSRICLRRVQIFWRLTGRASSIAQPMRSFACRPVLKSNCTRKNFAIRDFCGARRMATSLSWRVVRIKSR